MQLFSPSCSVSIFFSFSVTLFALLLSLCYSPLFRLFLPLRIKQLQVSVSFWLHLFRLSGQRLDVFIAPFCILKIFVFIRKTQCNILLFCQERVRCSVMLQHRKTTFWLSCGEWTGQQKVFTISYQKSMLVSFTQDWKLSPDPYNQVTFVPKPNQTLNMH